MRERLSVLFTFLFVAFEVFSQVRPAPEYWPCPDPSDATNLNREERVMYVDEMLPSLYLYNFGFNPNSIDLSKTILGNREKEEALLFYAALHDINYLVLYDLKKIFEKGPEEENAIRESWVLALNEFIVRANNKGIEIGLAIEDDHVLREADYDVNPSADNNVTTKEDVIARLIGDDSFGAWDHVDSILEKNKQVDINLLYALAGIHNLNNRIKAHFTREGTKNRERIVYGIKALVTEYEWWNLGDREPENIGVWTNGGNSNVFKRFVDYLNVLHAFSGLSHNRVIALEMYLGPLPTVSTRYRVDPSVETAQDYYDDLEDVVAEDDYPYWENWIAQMVYFGDRIIPTNHHFPYQLDLLYTSNQMHHLLLLFEREVAAKRQEIGGDYRFEVSPLFSAETNNYINGELRGRHKADLWGDLLNVGKSRGGESMYSLEERYGDRWEYDANGNGTIEPEETYESEYLTYVGGHWFSYAVMPNMVYSMNNPFHSKHKISNIGLDGLTGERFDYYPSSETPTIALEVHNPDRPVLPNGAPDNRELAGNTYTWHELVLDESLPSLGFDHSRFSTIENYNSPVLTVYNYPHARYYLISSEDSLGCKTYSLPVKVTYTNNAVYIRDDSVSTEPWAEPNNASTMTSPDIWINQETSAYNEEGEIAKDAIFENKNYVHVRVHNSGDIVSTGTELLHVFFSKNTLEGTWPTDWINRYADTSLVGDLLSFNITQIPKIAPNSDTVLTFEWTQFPTIDTAINQVDSIAYAEDRSYRIMARVQRSENGPAYGMTFPETSDYRANVINNNAIASTLVMIRDSSDLKKSTPTNIELHKKEEAFKIVPNPMEDGFWLSFEQVPGNASIAICNALGQMVYSRSLGKEKQWIKPNPHLPSGAYVVRVMQDAKVLGTQTLIVR